MSEFKAQEQGDETTQAIIPNTGEEIIPNTGEEIIPNTGEEIMPDPGEQTVGPEVRFRKIGERNISKSAIDRVGNGNAGFLTPNGPK